MYESPIKLFFPKLEEEICNIAKKQDEMVFDAVAKVGVTVDRDELLRALQYDRDQYDKGFNDGIMAAASELVRCSECVHDDTAACPLCWIENHTMQFINHDADFYCGKGERRSE